MITLTSGTAYSDRARINVIMWDNVNGDNHHFSHDNRPIRQQVRDAVIETIKLVNPRWSHTYPNYRVDVLQDYANRGKYLYRVWV